MSTADELIATTAERLSSALAARTREAFTELLTEDVHWGGEHGGNECTSRDQAGNHYAGLLAAGVAIHLDDLVSDNGDDDGKLVAQLRVEAPDPEDFPPHLTIRLTMRHGLIADIRELDPPPTVEVLYFEGCPHHDRFLPHLTELLAAHEIAAAVTLTRIDSEEQAQSHRFLGSPTIRINGRDVDPELPSTHRYGLQCRLYSTPEGETRGTPRDEWIIDALIDNPVHEAAVTAIHTGDLPTLRQVLADNPGLASIALPRHQGRTLLHVATDWPGHFPNVADTISALVAAGAHPDVGCPGDHPETPLHWAASSNDLDAIDALVANGADVNARGAVIAGGTPMADATAFGQWEAARRLLDHGADANLFEAASLGLVSEVQRHLAESQPTPEDVTSSFWGACHGGQVETAVVLADHGADINWVGYDDLTPLDAAQRAQASDMITWLQDHGAVSAG